MKQNAITIDCNNYLDLIQFIRVFQQFSVQFLTIACVSLSPNGDCKSYISQFLVLSREEIFQNVNHDSHNIETVYLFLFAKYLALVIHRFL